uniref:Uncharacterized protein n=1 Tax=Plectus sambesii TaxID=2011161 RepID=A0A914WVD7_9BILA
MNLTIAQFLRKLQSSATEKSIDARQTAIAAGDRKRTPQVVFMTLIHVDNRSLERECPDQEKENQLIVKASSAFGDSLSSRRPPQRTAKAATTASAPQQLARSLVAFFFRCVTLWAHSTQHT